MEFAPAVLMLISLLSLMIFGLVFAIFVMLLRGTARVIVRPPEELGGGTNPPKPPSEAQFNRLLQTLVAKGHLTKGEADAITGNTE